MIAGDTPGIGPDPAAFGTHLEVVCADLERALNESAAAGHPFEGILVHAGRATAYHADDIEVPFRSLPSFTRLAPLPGPGHVVVFRPGRPLKLVQMQAESFWAEAPEAPLFEVEAFFEIETVADEDALYRALGLVGDCAYLGAHGEAMRSAWGLRGDAIEPARLVASLDWDRARKTPYELGCLRGAAKRAAPGHEAVRDAAFEGVSERALHRLYLEASDQLEADLPYPNIIAWNQAAAYLHAERKRGDAPRERRALLIDAGARCAGYASDITRTWPGRDATGVFRALVDRLEALQRELVGRVKPGVPFECLHQEASLGVARLLSEAGIARGEPEVLLETGIAGAFLPHGLGHFLGLQVHDVGGRQRAREGGVRPPPEGSPMLRTTRTLEPDQVVTIEPGLYFIPMLLDALREGSERDRLDWRLVDELRPHGGIRIEDDVRVTEDGGEDLTRPYVPGHLDDR